jgi:hypothetical protein
MNFLCGDCSGVRGEGTVHDKSVAFLCEYKGKYVSVKDIGRS